jgi:hypothetical protein
MTNPIDGYRERLRHTLMQLRHGKGYDEVMPRTNPDDAVDEAIDAILALNRETIGEDETVPEVRLIGDAAELLENRIPASQGRNNFRQQLRREMGGEASGVEE